MHRGAGPGNVKVWGAFTEFDIRRVVPVMSERQYDHLKYTTEDGVLVITITEKELSDYEVCNALREELGEVVDHSDNSKVVMDFSQVEFVASVVFLPLLSLSGKLNRMRGRIVLCNLSEFIAEVFLATRLLIDRYSPDSPFQREANVAAAVANLNGTASD